jgi:hypothetical protein
MKHVRDLCIGDITFVDKIKGQKRSRLLFVLYLCDGDAGQLSRPNFAAAFNMKKLLIIVIVIWANLLLMINRM